MEGTIRALLENYDRASSMRLHMPGHGGALDRADVTELSGTDDLLDPRPAGAIRASERAAAKLFRVRQTLYSCSGATLCIQAGLAFLVSKLPPDAVVVCERRVHRSVLHALALLDLDPVFIEDPFDLPPRADLLIFCGCDYYGRIPDYARIARLCRDRGILTLVDHAHGAHLAFDREGELHPARYGFDLIVDSLHKTLNCLTGGALLHLSSDRFGDEEAAYEELKHFFRVFSTTSPSFLILRSIEDALVEASRDGKRILETERALFARLRERIPGLAAAPDGDPFRLVLRGSYDFEKLYFELSKRGVFCEFYERDALVMIPRFGFTEDETNALARTFDELLPLCSAKRAAAQVRTERIETQMTPVRKLSLRRALLSPGVWIDAFAAPGKLAGEVVGAYPPGNALVLPGEVLTKTAIERSGRSRIRVVEETEIETGRDYR